MIIGFINIIKNKTTASNIDSIFHDISLVIHEKYCQKYFLFLEQQQMYSPLSFEELSTISITRLIFHTPNDFFN